MPVVYLIGKTLKNLTAERSLVTCSLMNIMVFLKRACSP